MKNYNRVIFFLLNCFISHEIFALANTAHSKKLIATTAENHTFGAKTVNKPNCTEKLCIAKCCPGKQLLKYIKVIKTIGSNQLGSTLNDALKPNETKKITERTIGCAAHDKNNSFFPKIPVFNKTFYETDKKVNEHFNLVGPDLLNITNFTKTKMARLKLCKVYIMEDSTLVLEIPNMAPWERWSYYDKSMYCVDYLSSPRTGELTVKYYIIPPEDKKSWEPLGYYHLSAAMLVSCVFLSLVLVVYCLLPELRNLRGLMLMSYVFSLLIGFTSFTVMNILQNFNLSPTAVCTTTSYVGYFGFLSSFLWMNVMSLDIWLTFKGLTNICLIHRREEWIKYFLYCFYAWGVPLLMTCALIVLNERDMSHLPWFVTPQISHNGCFLSEGPRLLYLHVPILLVWTMNCIFFAMTVSNMRWLSRGHKLLKRAAAAAGTPAAHISNRNRLKVYLKLSAVMGVNWILEVVQSLKPDWPIWDITDVYNLLIGLFIFFIFVCKKKIWQMLLKRFSRQQGTGRTRWLLRRGPTPELSTSVSYCDVSQKTMSHTISDNTRRDDAVYK